MIKLTPKKTNCSDLIEGRRAKIKTKKDYFLFRKIFLILDLPLKNSHEFLYSTRYFLKNTLPSIALLTYVHLTFNKLYSKGCRVHMCSC